VQPLPFMSGVGPVMAAARNYVYSLNGELADKGVYVGTLTITAVVTGSAGHQALMAGELISKLPEGITMPEGMELPEGMQLPIVDPDVLAELYWELFTKRDRVEEIHPPMP
jgi:hypothetical protein